jgi:tRNA G18 (ribose-2'-O)-methylase SpoU
MKRGYFGLALYRPKKHTNWGSLVRTARILDCSFIVAIGARYPIQSSDTQKVHRHLPIYEFETFEEFEQFMPKIDCRLVGIELDDRAKELRDFVHPERAIYLLGAEDSGLPPKVMDKCSQLVKLKGKYSMNVACAGSIVLYHRQAL